MLLKEIQTDACSLGISGILLQKQTDNSLRPGILAGLLGRKSVYHS